MTWFAVLGNGGVVESVGQVADESFPAHQERVPGTVEVSQHVFEHIRAGGTWTFTDGQWRQRGPDPLIAASDARLSRNRLLAESDWTQLADAPLSAEVVQRWRDYRTALRGLTEQPGYPLEITWPVKP